MKISLVSVSYTHLIKNKNNFLIYLGGNIIMKLTPLGDRVVLKQLEAETKTKSGIVLTTCLLYTSISCTMYSETYGSRLYICEGDERT